MLAIIGLTAVAPAFAEEQTVTFSVPAMYCASCPFIVESAMGGVEGVVEVTADADTRTALVVFDDAIANTDTIAAASASVGYAATVLGSGS